LDPTNALFQGLPKSFHGCFLLLHKGVAVCTPTKSEAFVDLPKSATRFADLDYAQDRDALVSTYRACGLTAEAHGVLGNAITKNCLEASTG
jgi:hypothetical protein